MDGEFLNDGVCEQFGRQFGDPNAGFGVCSPHCLGTSSRTVAICATFIGDLHLEPLALANGDHLIETEPVARADDRLPLRVMNFGLEHDVDNYLGHAAQRTRSGHLTGQEERRVLSQRGNKIDDRPPTRRQAALSRLGVARGRQSCRASCLPIRRTG
jgi:hypothetical protein